ncbi:hypothetical protein NHX12_013627 [Muraenolepis orangiensis]|uniref:Uncharacterized protein n=1 Tax=Muraenolepis orangiensis TaxID=630683 RepID=A0A9Q0I3V0_9TELE|nr:hypothetical protein NHX12_013627 [Muraenolepis orangiensis]
MSRKVKEEYYRFFTVSDPRTHEKGHTEYKVTARGGEVTRPLDLSGPGSDAPLPPPLIPLPRRGPSDCRPGPEEEEGREAPVPPQDLGPSGRAPELGPEVASEAYGEADEGGPEAGPGAGVDEEGEGPEREEAEQAVDELSDAEPDDRVPSPGPPPEWSQESQDEFDSLFDSVGEERAPPPKEEAPPPLSDNDLAIFDPCCKQGHDSVTYSREQVVR